ncbi:MAG: hypothetical protein KKF65_00585 [Nanoarchaeota archaeon]|nr:hypothetical protein [Nanoarchaeota archaeon]
MNIKQKHFRTIWIKKGDEKVIQIIDQRSLPHKFIIEDLKSVSLNFPSDATNFNCTQFVDSSIPTSSSLFLSIDQ